MYSLFDLAGLLRVPESYYMLFAVLTIILVVVVALLKGIALWRAAKNNQKIWFWVFIFVNTVGILEIIYLLTSGEKKEKKVNNFTNQEETPESSIVE